MRAPFFRPIVAFSTIRFRRQWNISTFLSNCFVNCVCVRVFVFVCVREIRSTSLECDERNHATSTEPIYVFVFDLYSEFDKANLPMPSMRLYAFFYYHYIITFYIHSVAGGAGSGAGAAKDQIKYKIET